MAVNMVVSLVKVVFIIVIMHNIVPHRNTAADAFICSSGVVQEGSRVD